MQLLFKKDLELFLKNPTKASLVECLDNLYKVLGSNFNVIIVHTQQKK